MTDTLWQVSCEGQRAAWVSAPNWELATVAAADFWGVPWPAVAAKCDLLRKLSGGRRRICRECRQLFVGAGEVCPKCRKTEKTEKQQDELFLKRAYQSGKIV